MGITADFVLIVIAGLGGAIVARALGLPLLVGYVAAGVVVGPHTAGPTVVHIDDIELLAEIGVALLLFALGLEISFRDLRAVRRIALIGGPIQMLVTAVLGAVLVRAAFPVSGPDAVWFGAMISVSSTMVVLKTMAAQGTLGTLASRVMIGLLVVQDLAVVPMLIVLPQVGHTADALPALLRASAVATVFLAVMVIVGTRLLPGLLRHIVGWGSRELFLVAVLAIGVGVGTITFQLGFSFAIGAFVAGVVLSESELSHQALSDITPLRDIFGLMFFVTVGMLFDPRYVLEHAGTVAWLLAAIVAGKSLIFGLLSRVFGYTYMAPWIVGLGLSQIGEFSFVLARVGRSGGFIAAETYDLALTCTVLSMAISPLVFPGLLPLARGLARRVRPAVPVTATRTLPALTLENHVVVAGYGRTGRAVVAALQAAGVPYVIVEFHHETIIGPIEEGVPAVWGDIASEDIQRAAGLGQARMLVVAVPEWQAIHLGIERAKRLNPRLYVIARATGLAHVDDLRRLHADVIVQPEFEGGIEMVRRALNEWERDEAEIERVTSELRRALYNPSAAP